MSATLGSPAARYAMAAPSSDDHDLVFERAADGARTGSPQALFGFRPDRRLSEAPLGTA